MVNSLEKDFKNAYEEWSPKIFSFVLYKISNRERALDITQDVFIKSWDYLRKGNQIDNFQAFLYRTASNIVIDEYRKRARRKEVSLDKMTEEGYQIKDSSYEDVSNKTEVSNVLKTIDKLPEMYREAITYRIVEEMSIKEIAKILEEKPTNISVRVHRGINMLKAILEKKDEE